MSGKVCAVLGCNNFELLQLSKSFFRFPRDKTVLLLIRSFVSQSIQGTGDPHVTAVACQLLLSTSPTSEGEDDVDWSDDREESAAYKQELITITMFEIICTQIIFREIRKDLRLTASLIMEHLKALKTEPVSVDEAVDCLSGARDSVGPLNTVQYDIKPELHPTDEDIESEDNNENHVEHEPEAVHLVVPKFEMEYLDEDAHQEIHFEKKEVKLEYPERATEVPFEEEDSVRVQDLTLQESKPFYQDLNVQEKPEGLNEQQINDIALQCKGSVRVKHIPRELLKCSVCLKEFRHFCDLKRHFLIHSEKTFSCEVCSRRFAQRSNLKVHMLIHSGDRSFECMICNRKFARRSNLNEHSVTHTGERKFSCPSCPRRFALRNNLLSHQVVHTKEKKYTCDVCGHQFCRLSHLKAHLEAKCGQKFRCPKCPKGFSEVDKLNLHIALHTRQMRFRCSMCDARFTFKSSLKRHIENHCIRRAVITASDG